MVYLRYDPMVEGQVWRLPKKFRDVHLESHLVHMVELRWAPTMSGQTTMDIINLIVKNW